MFDKKHIPRSAVDPDTMFEEMAANSFMNFHAKGVDYLCLHRSENITLKVYFFEGDVQKLPEVVHPHSHRYNFQTTVLCGHMSDTRYRQVKCGGTPYQRHAWHPPIAGGNGATFQEEVNLAFAGCFTLGPEDRLTTHYNELHTIKINSDQCVLFLKQYRDVVPLDKPTWLFTGQMSGPNLDGLYERMTPEHARMRFKQYQQLKLS